MTARQLATRFALFTCTALGTWTITAPAVAANIPTGAPRSPLLNGATPFSQKLLLFEEFGLQSMPTVADSGARLPIPGACNDSPGSSALDAFLAKPLSPAPAEEANVADQNPWRAKINACLGLALAKSPIEGR